MSEPREIIVKTVKTEVERAAWRKLSEDPIFGTMYQCAWWAEPLKCYGVGTHLIGVWHKGCSDGGRAFPIYTGSLYENIVAPMFRRADFQGVGPILGGALHSGSRRCCPDSKKHGGRHRQAVHREMSRSIC